MVKLDNTGQYEVQSQLHNRRGSGTVVIDFDNGHPRVGFEDISINDANLRESDIGIGSASGYMADWVQKQLDKLHLDELHWDNDADEIQRQVRECIATLPGLNPR